MPKSVAIIDGHPDPEPARFCHALAQAYAEGANAAGHDVTRLSLAEIDVPVLRSQRDWEDGEAPAAIRAAQKAIAAADHLVIIYPLWLGDMPALLKAFLEQTLRPGFAVKKDRLALNPGLLRGKSARIVVTMGMPAFVYRWFYCAHSLRSLKRNVLKFCGIGKIRESLIGNIEQRSMEGRTAILKGIRRLGRSAL